MNNINPSTRTKGSLFEQVTPDNTLEMINARAANNGANQNFANPADNTVNGIAAQANPFNMQAMTEIQKLMNEKFMLQMALERMKRMRQEIPNDYSVNYKGVGVCTKPNGIHIDIGKIQIQHIAEYKIFKDDTYNDFIYVSYIDSKDNERRTVISAKNLASKNLVGSFIGFEYICKKI